MSDPYHLQRYLDAQKNTYPRAISELELGRKRSHWMWYIFPQFTGLGHSNTAQYYAITSLPEARAYVDHPLLGPRLLQATQTTLQHAKALEEIFAYPDNLKFCSSMTLFEKAAPAHTVFTTAIEQFCHGKRDAKTLQLIQAKNKHY